MPRKYQAPRTLDTRVWWSVLAAGAMVIVSAGIGIGFTSVVVSVATNSAAAKPPSELPSEPSGALALGQALTAALNRHEVDTLVALFTEERDSPAVMPYKQIVSEHRGTPAASLLAIWLYRKTLTKFDRG